MTVGAVLPPVVVSRPVNGFRWGKLGVMAVCAACMGLPAAASASFIVYRCGSPAELCRINPDGTGQQQLTSDGATAAYHGASLDPAGTRMVFSRDTSSLYASDGNVQNVVGPISTFSQTPKISFDGTMAVDTEFFPSVDEFAVCTFSTSNPGSDNEWGRQCNGAGRFPAFTPSGQIVASILNNGHDEICLYAAGSCASDLAVDPSRSLDEAAVSPDGKTLAVVAIQPGGSDPAGGHIALYSMSTGQLIGNLTNGTTDETPAWSPDGTRIVFSRNRSLYVIAAAGPAGSEKLLVSGGDTPTWGGPRGPHDGGSSKLPTVTIVHPAKVKLHALIHGGIAITIRASAPVAAGVVLALDSGTAKRLGLGKKVVELATKTAVVTTSKTLTVAPKARFDGKLSKARRFTLDVVVVIQDAAGDQAQRAYTVTVTK